MNDLYIVVSGYGDIRIPRECSGVYWSRPFAGYCDAVEFADYLRAKFGGGIDNYFCLVCDAVEFAAWLDGVA